MEVDASSGGQAPLAAQVHKEDLELVRSALGGALTARRELGERLKCIERILRMRNAKLGSPLKPQELPDLAQEVAAIVWRKLDVYEGRASIETWVYRIGSLELMNGLRKNHRRIVRTMEAEEDASMAWVSSHNDPMSAELQFEGLYQCLGRLDVVESKAIQMKHYESMTFDEMGTALGLTSSGAKHQYYKALVKLKLLLKDRESGDQAR